MQKRKLKLGFASKREIDQFLREVREIHRENPIQKAAFRMASQFERDIFEFALEKMVKKVLSVKHTEYMWDDGRIDTYYKFFTEDEKDTAIEYSKNFGENIVEYDFTKLAEMSDDEFLRLSYSYTGDNEEIVRKWRDAVRNGK
jgi:KaiC/GvpD/RAD55 family RecA-like ATPase